MVRIDGIQGVVSAINKLIGKAKKDRDTVVVGFSQSYAIYVHEINKNYRVGGWKYLERAMRENEDNLRKIVSQSYKKDRSLRVALLRAGLRLQREAQQRVPVDTSALKASAYTAYENKADAEARKARSQSDKFKAKKSK